MPNRSPSGPSRRAIRFYRGCLQTLNAEHIPFMVGGTFALSHYTTIVRHTKDLDVFVKAEDRDRTLAALESVGFEVEVVNPAWLAKAYDGEKFVDIIYRARNGLAAVDDQWFEFAPRGQLFGVDVLYTPPEESIWSKAFTMERERFDFADIIHIIQSCASEMDWQRLLDRFDRHWRVLFSYLTLFGYVYPGERDKVPAFVMENLTLRLLEEMRHQPVDHKLCQGTFLSCAQFLVDVLFHDYVDARFSTDVPMTSSELQEWKTYEHEIIYESLSKASLALSAYTTSADELGLTEIADIGHDGGNLGLPPPVPIRIPPLPA